MTIKALETRFDGVRFRSRLEARWAFMFKKLGILYNYEPEGFDLGSVWYLPDFWLPEYSCYFEIKPEQPDSHALKKLALLAQGTQKSSFIWWPPAGPYPPWTPDGFWALPLKGKLRPYGVRLQFGICPTCSALSFACSLNMQWRNWEPRPCYARHGATPESWMEMCLHEGEQAWQEATDHRFDWLGVK